MINLTEYESKMNKSLEVLKREFNGLRTGRASVSLLDSIYIDAYGSSVPLNQVSNISVPESRLITVQVWDENLLTAVESTIRNSDSGLNPMLEGNLIRIPIPELSEERRKELAKIASKYSEDYKVSVRNVRREAMEKIKVLEKDKEISKDESFKLSDQVQEITDTLIEKIDMLFNEKEKDILKSIMALSQDYTKLLPKHVAFIMDGNRRWAKKKLPVIEGHKMGSEITKKIVAKSLKLGIKYLTFYSFSTENWNRSRSEVLKLQKLLEFYLDSEIENFKKKK